MGQAQMAEKPEGLIDWINSLPLKFKSYLHDLETQCDPPGYVRDLHCAKEAIVGLEVMVEEQQAMMGGYRIAQAWLKLKRQLQQDTIERLHAAMEEIQTLADREDSASWMEIHEKILEIIRDALKGETG